LICVSTTPKEKATERSFSPGMSIVREHEPTAVKVAVTSDRLIVDRADGRSLTVPLAWYPRLLHGSRAERQNWQLLGEGYAAEWPELDEHIGVEGLLTGRGSGKSIA
jgi:hypothetical protein